MSPQTIAIIGVGIMGEMVLGGLLAHDHNPDHLILAVRRPERGAELEATYGVQTVPAADAVHQADVLVLGVKPQDMGALLDQIAESVRPGTIVISLAAGLRADFFEQRMAQTRVVRAIPNTPGLVGEGMTLLAAGASADEDALATAKRIMRTVGRVVELPQSQLDLATSISGSGPAYVFLLTETMRDAAIANGLDPELASLLARQAVIGAGALLRESSDAPEVLRANVTSKKGMTHEAITTLEARGIREAMTEAVAAAVNRARELANGG